MRKQYEYITDLVLTKLKEGVVPWEHYTRLSEPPKNMATDRPYRGINPFLLSLNGHSSPNYLTYNQAKELGGQVRKGERSSRIFFFKPLKKKDKKGNEETIPILKHYFVFNISQIDGLEDPWKPTTYSNKERRECELIKNAPHLPAIEEGSFQVATYNLGEDKIRLPKLEYCISSDHYYSTFFHEIIHGTGHKSRLDRPLTGYKRTKAYAKEELIAELGSAMLCSHYGFLKETIDNAASYIDYWISVFTDHKDIMYNAAAKAQTAVDYVLEEKNNDERAKKKETT